jgi:hypothetical protein
MYLRPVELFLDLVKSIIPNLPSTTQSIESATLRGNCPALDHGKSRHCALTGFPIAPVVSQSSLIFSTDNGSCFGRFLSIENIQGGTGNFSSCSPHLFFDYSVIREVEGHHQGT